MNKQTLWRTAGMAGMAGILGMAAWSAPAMAATAAGEPHAPLAHWPLDDGAGKLAAETVSARRDPVNYVFNHARFKPASAPLWRPAATCIRGGCLLFDGYSTDIAAPGLTAAQLARGFTLSAWVAPHAFEWGDGGHYSAFLSQFDTKAQQGLSFGMYRFGTWGLKLGFGGAAVDARVNDRKLPRDAWSHVAASYDPATHRIALFLNGEQVLQVAAPADAALTMPALPLTVGRYSQPERIGGVFKLNTFLGLMDEVRVTAGPSAAADVVQAMAADLQVGQRQGAVPKLAPADLQIAAATFDGDRDRPRYHLQPDAGWMNEPHAPFYYGGQYHLFFQKNPFGPFWHQIHWGHWVSPDLVHWRELPIALAPEDDGLATDGVWSGSATYAADGTPVLFFTAGNDAVKPNQRTGMATPADITDPDLARWTKYPVPVTEQTEGQGRFGEFRDPFVFRNGDRWYQLVGSALPGRSGTALVYESSDLRHWTPRGPLFSVDASRYPGFEATWELPVLLPVGKGVDGRERHVFLNDVRGQAYYWTGVFDAASARFTPDQEAPRVFDVGHGHFSGPSGFVDPKTGRSIVFSIAQGRRSLQDEHDAGWAHNAGLPVTLSLGADGGLRVAPIAELATLRRAQLLDLHDVTAPQAAAALAGLHGLALEVELELAPSAAAGKRGLALRVAPGHAGQAEATQLYVDTARNRLEIDRSRSATRRQDGGGKGSGMVGNNAGGAAVQGGDFALGGEPLRLRLFLDGSMVEAYVNERLSLTSRIYPNRPDADGLGLLAQEGDRVLSLKVWALGLNEKRN